eukprot:1860821-Pyramimonas_sp.AAC.1
MKSRTRAERVGSASCRFVEKRILVFSAKFHSYGVRVWRDDGHANLPLLKKKEPSCRGAQVSSRCKYCCVTCAVASTAV